MKIEDTKCKIKGIEQATRYSGKRKYYDATDISNALRAFALAEDINDYDSKEILAFFANMLDKLGD